MSDSGFDYEALRERIAGLREGAGYRTEQAIYSITEDIVNRMLELDLSRVELASRLGVSPARVTNLLRGANNFTLRTLTELAMALDCDLAIGLVPHQAGASVEREPQSEAGGAEVAAEARAVYQAERLTHTYASRDKEIREHLSSGKLKVEGDSVLMRHERDRAYRPARFRKAGTHSAMEKTNVGRRAYYRDRIIAISREMGQGLH